jgi:hypothetical protein
LWYECGLGFAFEGQVRCLLPLAILEVSSLLVLTAASVAAARPLRDRDVHAAAARANGRRVGRGRPRWRRARATSQARGRGLATSAAAAAAFQGDQERGRLVDFEQPLDRVDRATIVSLQPHAAAFGELEAPGWPKLVISPWAGLPWAGLPWAGLPWAGTTRAPAQPRLGTHTARAPLGPEGSSSKRAYTERASGAVGGRVGCCEPGQFDHAGSAGARARGTVQSPRPPPAVPDRGGGWCVSER